MRNTFFIVTMPNTAVLTKPTPSLLAEENKPSYRELPYNIPAEKAVLGAILVNNELINRVGDFLTAEHFYEPVHQRIYASIQQFMDKGMLASPVTLKNIFDKDEALTDIGGAEYLGHLAGLAMTVVSINDFARTIYNLAMRRKLIDIGQEVVSEAFEKESEAREHIERAEQKLFNLATEGSADTGFRALKNSLLEAITRLETVYKRQEMVSGTHTGFEDLDRLLGGLQDSDLLILAGRPSMGKTAFAINIAVNAAKFFKKQPRAEDELPKSVGVFSLEMSAEQLAMRMVAMESGINSSKIRVGTVSNEEFQKLAKTSKELHSLPFFIDDTPALTISALRTRARRLKRRFNLGLIVVDYLQLLRGVSGASEQNRVQEVSEITQGLKAVAKELNIPVIALSQLSRAVEQREDKRPQLSDLRESGSIEQDSDIVMFIFREEYYISRHQPPEGSPKHAEWQAEMDRVMNKAEIIIAKQRNGPIGNVGLYFDSNTTRFGNLADQPYGGGGKVYG